MIKAILLVSTLICLSPARVVIIGGDTKDENGYYHAGDFDYIECPPLDPNGTNIKAKVSFLKGSSIARIYSIIANYDDLGVSETVLSMTNSLAENDINVTYVPSYKSDARIVFSVMQKSTLKNLARKEITASYITNDRIWGRNLKGSFETEANYVFYERKDGTYFDKDIIELSGIDGTYETDSFQRIDFSNFRIKYHRNFQETTQFPYKNITFTMQNTNELFNELGLLSFDRLLINLELKLKYDDVRSDYYLAFKDPCYVNPSTYKMSSTLKDGYVETNSLYLPRGYEEQYSLWTVGFVIYDIGFNKIQLANPFTINSTSRMMGGCANAEYCIKSEDAEPNFDVGKVVEH